MQCSIFIKSGKELVNMKFIIAAVISTRLLDISTGVRVQQKYFRSKVNVT